MLMRRWIVLLCGFLFASNALATHSLNSELSHASAGALIAGGATVLAGQRWPEHRALIGFATSTALGFAGEGLQRASGGKFSLLDAASNAVGAAIGAFVTDHYLLTPVIQRSAGQTVIGVVARAQF